MRADEHYPGDYQTIEILRALVGLLDTRDEKAFGSAMGVLWSTLQEKIPETAQKSAAWLVVDSYFKMHGDLRQALRLHEEQMEKTVGYSAHQEVMERMKLRCEETVRRVTDYLRTRTE